MTVESFHRALTLRPFRPFTIVQADGHEIPVSHPELVAHPENARIAVVMLSETQIEWVDLLPSSRLVFHEPAPA